MSIFKTHIPKSFEFKSNFVRNTDYTITKFDKNLDYSFLILILDFHECTNEYPLQNRQLDLVSLLLHFLLFLFLLHKL